MTLRPPAPVTLALTETLTRARTPGSYWSEWSRGDCATIWKADLHHSTLSSVLTVPPWTLWTRPFAEHHSASQVPRQEQYLRSPLSRSAR